MLAVAVAAATAVMAAATDQALRGGQYSADQATRGKVVYTTFCAGCHLADLSGTLSGDGGAPPLRGEPFLVFIETWNARQLFDYIQATMPADDPSALTSDHYLDVLAYIFEMNGYPSGPGSLDVRQLQNIRMSAPGRAERDTNR